MSALSSRSGSQITSLSDGTVQVINVTVVQACLCSSGGQTIGTVLMFHQSGGKTTQSRRMNNYRAAVAFYLLLLNAKVKQFLPAQAEETKALQNTSALLHY